MSEKVFECHGWSVRQFSGLYHKDDQRWLVLDREGNKYVSFGTQENAIDECRTCGLEDYYYRLWESIKELNPWNGKIAVETLERVAEALGIDITAIKKGQ